MQCLVDLFGQVAADARNLGQVLDARPHDALEPAESGQKLPPPFAADARYAFEHRGHAFLAAARPMAGNGKSMRFIPDGLYQVQGRVIGGQVQRIVSSRDPQFFQPRPALRALGYAHQGQVAQPQLRESIRRSMDLAFASIDKNEVGCHPKYIPPLLSIEYRTPRFGIRLLLVGPSIHNDIYRNFDLDLDVR